MVGQKGTGSSGAARTPDSSSTGGRPTRELHIAVVGAGVGGLTAALLLSRAGHRVTLLERDKIIDDRRHADGPSDRGRRAPGADNHLRPGAPQARHSHAFLGRLRKLVAEHLPDLLDALHQAGATEYHVLEDLPDTIDDPSPRPGDEDLVLLACRRTTFEAVLRDITLAEAGVTVMDRVTVEGLTFDETLDEPGTTPQDRHPAPTVTGVRLLRDGGEGSGHDPQRRTLGADIVVAAGGPRQDVGSWLTPMNVTVPETYAESGIVYLSRFYRLKEGAEPAATGSGAADSATTAPGGGEPQGLGLAAVDIGYLKCAVFRGDNETFSVTLAPRSTDRELRTGLRDPEAFDLACRSFPGISPWIHADRAEAISDVYVMGRLGNRQRRFLSADGDPLVLGFHALGDAHTSTNPLYGRGCTMAVLHATLLARAVTDHPDDPEERSRTYEQATTREIEPWYHVAVAQDQFSREAAAAARARKARARAQDSDDRRAGPSQSPDDATGTDNAAADEATSGPAFIGKVIREGLLPAARTDAVVARAFLRVLNAFQTPASLLTDPDVTQRILQTMANPPDEVALPAYQVRRRDLLAAIAATERHN